MYAGRTGVSYQSHAGGGNYLCMPNDPEYRLRYCSGVQGNSYVYGTEYEYLVRSNQNDQYNAPCAVCYVPTKHTVLMIPAKISCPSGWTREYYGYLMAERTSHRRSTYACVDNMLERIPNSRGHVDGGHFYHVEA